MGLKNFLKEQGFIQDDEEDKKKSKEELDTKQVSTPVVEPTFFPVHTPVNTVVSAPPAGNQTDPVFVTPLQQTTASKDQPDPSFVKFFEDELLKANLPGPDYFEFRQLLVKTQEKMAAKGMTAPEVVLQAVLTSFEAQGTPRDKIIEAAKKYKDIIKQKNDDFLKGAANEKNNQLQKRQNVMNAHDANIKKVQQQLQQLEAQKQLLEESISKEKTQMEVDRTLGQEGIEKIERAEKLIALAHNHMQSAIDADIEKLRSV